MNVKTLRRTVAVALTVISATVAFAQPLPLPEPQNIETRAGLPSDLILNDDFENGLNNWSLKNPTKDKVKCGNVGHLSDCAMLLKGSAGENSRLQQSYKVNGDVTDGSQYIAMVAHVKPGKAGLNAKFMVKVKFNDGASPMKAAYTYVSTQQQAENNGYSSLDFTTNYFNPATVKKVVVQIDHKSTSGKLFVDGLYVGAYGAMADK